eukprot:Hpha_TRINITY_DN10462_c0_g1::TRINITY_DN10462_c0_g1_i1::g.193385::m.193385
MAAPAAPAAAAAPDTASPGDVVVEADTDLVRRAADAGCSDLVPPVKSLSATGTVSPDVSPSHSMSSPLRRPAVAVKDEDLVELGLRDLCELAIERGHSLADVNHCGNKYDLMTLLKPRQAEGGGAVDTTAPEDMRPPFASVAALLVTVFVDYLGVFLSLPILPFLVLDLGGSVGDVGNIMASFSAAQLLSMIWMPLLSDKIGRKPVVIMSNLGSALGYIAVGMSNKIWMLYAFRTASGLFAGTMGVVQAQLVDIVPAPLLPTYQGYLAGSLFIGLAFGPTIAGSVSTFGNDVPFYVAGAMAGLSTINTVLFLKSKKKPPPAAPAAGAVAASSAAPASEKKDVKVPTVIYWASFVRFLAMFSVRAQGSVTAVHLQKVRGWKALEVSFLYMGLAVLQIAFQAIAYKSWYQKMSLPGVTALGCLVGAIFSFFVEPASKISGPGGSVAFVAIYECFMVGGIVAMLPLGAITGTLSPPSKRGLVASVDMAMGAAGQVAGSLAAPKVFEESSFWVFGMCGGVQLIGLAVALYMMSGPIKGLGIPKPQADTRMESYEHKEKYDYKEEARFLDELRQYLSSQFREKNYFPGTACLTRRKAVQAGIKLVLNDSLPFLHPWGSEERNQDVESFGRRAPHVRKAMARIIEGEDPGAVLKAYS